MADGDPKHRLPMIAALNQFDAPVDRNGSTEIACI
jgi:hypothetical protein